MAAAAPAALVPPASGGPGPAAPIPAHFNLTVVGAPGAGGEVLWETMASNPMVKAFPFLDWSSPVVAAAPAVERVPALQMQWAMLVACGSDGDGASVAVAKGAGVLTERLSPVTCTRIAGAMDKNDIFSEVSLSRPALLQRLARMRAESPGCLALRLGRGDFDILPPFDSVGTPGVPGVRAIPARAAVRAIPAVPAVVAVPRVMAVRARRGHPAVRAAPAIPGRAAVPAVAAVAAVAAVPAVPAVPATPATPGPVELEYLRLSTWHSF